MIIRDIRRDFFDQLAGRILILCSMDVDAICACKILQFLLESYNLQYSVAPVASLDSLWKLFEEYRNSIDAVVLINFGNLINIPRVLSPPENLNFYVVDSHRPINVFNFYKNQQVKVYVNNNEKNLNIPAKSKLFLTRNKASRQRQLNDDEENQETINQNEPEDDDGDDDIDDDQTMNLLNADPRDLTNEQLVRRRELREWLVQKQKLMFEYEEFHFYNRSVSMIMYDLAWYLSKNNNYLVWLGIVGLTYLYKAEKADRESFEEEAERLIRHVARNQVSKNHARGNGWVIKWRDDVQLDLYRKWRVYESFWNTPLTVCRLQLWNDKGQRNLLEFLVECGLKLVQCKQEYVAMDFDYKSKLVKNIESICRGEHTAGKYNLEDLVKSSFVLYHGFKRSISASDVVLAVRALLESHEPELSPTEKFVRAIQSLSSDDFGLLEKGFEKARNQLKSMFELVKTVIVTLKVVDSGVFLHLDLQEQMSLSKDFCGGDSLMAFARFLLNAYISSKSRRVARRLVRLPLLLLCPDSVNEEQVSIVGVPPLAQESKKNFFSKAFEQAAANIDCEIRTDLSETNLVKVSIHMKNQLLEQIKLLLDQS